MILPYLLVLSSTVFTGVAHVCLKSYAVAKNTKNVRSPLDARLLSGLFFFSGSVLVNIVAFRFLEFSTVYAVTALNYFFVSLLSYLALKEPFDISKIAGNLFIVIGLVIYLS